MPGTEAATTRLPTTRPHTGDLIRLASPFREVNSASTIVSRTKEEMQKWEEQGPIERTRQILEERGLWDIDQEAMSRQRLRSEITGLLASAEKLKKPAM